MPGGNCLRHPYGGLEVRKDYPTLRAAYVDELPDGWAVNEIEQDFTVTLCLFMGTPASRVRGHDGHFNEVYNTALPLQLRHWSCWCWLLDRCRAAALLCTEPRMQLAVASLGYSALCLSLLWGLDMEA